MFQVGQVAVDGADRRRAQLTGLLGLARSRAEAGIECFLVPIDVCYELAGRMRMLWQGFDGGAEARQSIAEFLDSVRSRARDLAPEP